jgi:hypothetical protein
MISGALANERTTAARVETSMFGIRRAKIVLVAFVLFLAWVILMADSGGASWLFNFVRLIPAGDKAGHFVLYGILSFLVNHLYACATLQFGPLTVKRGSLMVMIPVTIEEFTQLFFARRTFDLVDLVAGAFGIWFFGLVAARFLRWRQARLAVIPIARDQRR